MLTEESGGLTPVQQSVIIRKRNNHDWSNNDFSVYYHRPLLYRMHPCQTI